MTDLKSPVGPPPPEEFFLKVGLYQEFTLSDKDPQHAEDVLSIEFYPGSIKTLCLDCGEDSVFRTDRIQSGELTSPQRPHAITISDGQKLAPATRATLDDLIHCQPWSHRYALSDHAFHVHFYCTRVFTHRLFFSGVVKGQKLLKIGQFPSFADLASTQVAKYRKVLGPDRAREYMRAINLFSHDIGIGSFVYLRRIIETLIEDAHQLALKDPSWQDSAWAQMRVVERIQALGSRIPAFLRENTVAYAVLSKGVHELSEQQCLQYFPVLRGAIDLILEERRAQLEMDARRQEIARALGGIHSDLKNAPETPEK